MIESEWESDWIALVCEGKVWYLVPAAGKLEAHSDSAANTYTHFVHNNSQLSCHNGLNVTIL